MFLSRCTGIGMDALVSIRNNTIQCNTIQNTQDPSLLSFIQSKQIY